MRLILSILIVFFLVAGVTFAQTSLPISVQKEKLKEIPIEKTESPLSGFTNSISIFLSSLFSRVTQLEQTKISSAIQDSTVVVLDTKNVSKTKEAVDLIRQNGGAVSMVYMPNTIVALKLPTIIEPKLKTNYGAKIYGAKPDTISGAPRALENALSIPKPKFIEKQKILVIEEGPSIIPKDKPKQFVPIGGVGYPPPSSTVHTSAYMYGDVFVSVILPESNGSIDLKIEDWSQEEESRIDTAVADALNWWVAASNTYGRLNGYKSQLTFWTYPQHYKIPTSYEPSRNPEIGDEGKWINEIMDDLGVPEEIDAISRVRSYNNLLRTDSPLLKNRTGVQNDWAFVIFVIDVSKIETTFRSHAYLGGPYQVDYLGLKDDEYNVVRTEGFKRTIVHETGHTFGALDQYDGSWGCDEPSDCTLKAGLLQVENQNCMNSCKIDQDSIMKSYSGYEQQTIDPYAAGQIGWRDENKNGIIDSIDIEYNKYDTDVDGDGIGNYWDTDDSGPEVAPPPDKIPTISNFRFEITEDRKLTISWKTDDISGTFIEIDRNQPDIKEKLSDLEKNIANIDYWLTNYLGSTDHTYTTPTPLLPGTTYYFRIIARNALGNEAKTGINIFTTKGALPDEKLPNLVPVDILFNNTAPKPGENVVAFVIIKNSGNAYATIKSGSSFINLHGAGISLGVFKPKDDEVIPPSSSRAMILDTIPFTFKTERTVTIAASINADRSVKESNTDDNVFTKDLTFTRLKFADLTVTDAIITSYPRINQPTTIILFVSNLGTADADFGDSKSLVIMKVDGSTEGTLGGLVKAGSSLQLQQSWTPHTDKDYTLTFEANAWKLVDESNENNNVFTRTVNVLSGTVECLKQFNVALPDKISNKRYMIKGRNIVLSVTAKSGDLLTIRLTQALGTNIEQREEQQVSVGSTGNFSRGTYKIKVVSATDQSAALSLDACSETVTIDGAGGISPTGPGSGILGRAVDDSKGANTFEDLIMFFKKLFGA